MTVTVDVFAGSERAGRGKLFSLVVFGDWREIRFMRGVVGCKPAGQRCVNGENGQKMGGRCC